ncbi:uncharacterized protein LOC143879388 [Tasmannia lanceolata]|uniref:uncharacterized protein LOC143879388 n=1 Tax=Tasmannia lanceolata TaxID=3420 RepID=UPI004063F4E1
MAQQVMDILRPTLQCISVTVLKVLTSHHSHSLWLFNRMLGSLPIFLQNPGLLSKEAQTCISAKAQRKVGRMIKITRAFGLMPFTVMVTIPFAFGKALYSICVMVEWWIWKQRRLRYEDKR